MTKTNTPQLRFPEFTDEWQEKKLDEFCNSISSGKSKTKDIKNGKYPVYGSTGKIGFSNDYDYSGNKILVARVGANAGKLYQVYNNYLVSDNTLILELKRNVEINFIYDSLIKKNLNRIVFGSGQPLVTGSQLKKLKINIPSKSEQQKIADFLEKVDEKIKSLEKKKNLFSEYKKSVMQKIFSQEVRFKDENGKKYPDWEEKKLANVVDFKNGKAHEKDISINGKYIVINSKFISSEGDVKKFSNKQLCPVCKNEITMVMSDVPNGKAIAKCFLVKDDNKYTLNQRICALTLKKEFVNSQYLINVINRNPFYLKFDDGIKQTNLRRNDVTDLPIILPVVKEQQKIADFLTSLDNKIDQINNKLTQAKLFKKSLLQKMFV